MSKSKDILNMHGKFGTAKKQSKQKALEKATALPELLSDWLKWSNYHQSLLDSPVTGGGYDPKTAFERIQETRKKITDKKIHVNKIPELAMGYLIQKWHDTDQNNQRTIDYITRDMFFLLKQYPDNENLKDLAASDKKVLNLLNKYDGKAFREHFDKQAPISSKSNPSNNARPTTKKPDSPRVIIGRSRSK